MDDITGNVVKECLGKVQSFLESYADKTHLEMVCVCMDKITKGEKERKYIYLLEENNSPCSGKKIIVHAVSTQKTRVRELHAEDACYYLDCWLGVTIEDIAAAWVKL